MLQYSSWIGLMWKEMERGRGWGEEYSGKLVGGKIYYSIVFPWAKGSSTCLPGK